MKETNAISFATAWLALNPCISEVAQQDPAMMAAAAQSMASTIARLPCAMPWSVQPVVVMRVPQDSTERLIDKAKSIF